VICAPHNACHPRAADGGGQRSQAARCRRSVRSDSGSFTPLPAICMTGARWSGHCMHWQIRCFQVAHHARLCSPTCPCVASALLSKERHSCLPSCDNLCVSRSTEARAARYFHQTFSAHTRPATDGFAPSASRLWPVSVLPPCAHEVLFYSFLATVLRRTMSQGKMVVQLKYKLCQLVLHKCLPTSRLCSVISCGFIPSTHLLQFQLVTCCYRV